MTLTPTHADRVRGGVEQLLADHALAEWPDSRLLEHFVRSRDEAAFAALLSRHGPMVLRVCRAVLHDSHDAEDAFQATFLVLACSASRVRSHTSLGSFLHGTAYRVAARARARAIHRRAVEQEAGLMRASTTEGGPESPEMEAALHEALARMPEKYRQVIVLCYLEGKSHAQAAAEVGCPVGSVSRRLRRACELLRERLSVGRSCTPSGQPEDAVQLRPTGRAPLAPVPAALARATLEAVGKYVSGTALVGGAAVPAVILADEVLKASTALKFKGVVALLLLVGLVAGGAALFTREEPVPPAPAATQPGPPDAPRAKVEVPAVGLDRHGDSLPEGAVARLGTTRLRHGGEVLALAFTRDGNALVSLGHEQVLRLWDVPAGRELARLPGQRSYTNAAAFSPDGKTLAAVDKDGAIRLYDFQPARPREQKPPEIGPERLRIEPAVKELRFLAFLPNGDLVSGTVNGGMHLWDGKTGKQLRAFGTPLEVGPFVPELNRVHLYALSPDGKTLAFGWGGPTVALWDTARGEALEPLRGNNKVASLAFSPDGKTLAVGDEPNVIHLWDLKTRQVTAKLSGEKEPHQVGGMGDAVKALCFTPDGKTLVAAGDLGDGTIRVWDVQAAKERRRFKGANGDSQFLAVAPDGKTLAVAGSNNTVRLWDLTTGKELDAGLGSQGRVNAVAVSPDGKQVAAAGSDGVIRLWERATGKELRSWRGHKRDVSTLDFSPNGMRLLSSAEYDSARLWDVSTGQEVRSFNGQEGNTHGVTQARFCPDGKRVALLTYLPSVQLVDVTTGKVEATLAREIAIQRVAFSPDGKRLVGGGYNQAVVLWDLTTQNQVWSVTAGNPHIASVAYSANGKFIAAGLHTSEVVIYDAATGKEVRRLDGRLDRPRAVALSPDGRLLAISGDTTGVALYEVSTGQLIRRFAGHAGYVWTLAFTPDGRSLVSGSWDATALVWDLTGRDVAQKRRGPLTDDELEALWEALTGSRADSAHQATLSLANAPRQAPGFLRTRLAGDPAPDAKKVAQWLRELDDEDFAVREQASRALGQLGGAVEADLKRTRDATTSAEVRRRVDELLERLGSRKPADERVRAGRVVAVLELAATAEAKELLEHLAKQGPSGDLREHAHAALDRMAKRP